MATSSGTDLTFDFCTIWAAFYHGSFVLAPTGQRLTARWGEFSLRGFLLIRCFPRPYQNQLQFIWVCQLLANRAFDPIPAIAHKRPVVRLATNLRPPAADAASLHPFLL